MIVSIIAAMSRNRVIGQQGTIPWKIPEDMRKFRELTAGHALIMGRRTFESIGRPLPGRKNIIITRQTDYTVAGCLTASSLDEALHLAEPASEVFICGGGTIYRQALPFAAKIYLTVINDCFAGDTTFPEIPAEEFALIANEKISVAPEADLNIFVRKSHHSQQETDETH